MENNKATNLQILKDIFEKFGSKIKYVKNNSDEYDFKPYKAPEELFLVKETNDPKDKIHAEILKKITKTKEELLTKEKEFNEMIGKTNFTVEIAKEFIDNFNKINTHQNGNIDSILKEVKIDNGINEEDTRYNFFSEEGLKVAENISDSAFLKNIEKNTNKLKEIEENYKNFLKRNNLTADDLNDKKIKINEKINDFYSSEEAPLDLSSNDIKFNYDAYRQIIMYFSETVLGAARIVVYVRDVVEGLKETSNTGCKEETKNIPTNCGDLLVKNGNKVPTDAEKYLKRRQTFLMIPPQNNNNNINPDLIPKIYGPFTNVYENTTTKNMYNGGFKPFISKLQNGKNVLIFGFGFSGSGKTYQLIEDRGDNTNDPKNILQLFMDDLNKNTEKKLTGISVNVKELYPKKGNIKLFETIENKFDKEVILPTLQGDDIDDFIKEFMKANKEIEKHRIYNMRITPTPNNPVSSRSHIFYEFNLTFSENGKKITSKLVIVDMAGTENTIQIKKLFLGIDKFKDWNGGKKPIPEIQKDVINDINTDAIKKFTNEIFGTKINITNLIKVNLIKKTLVDNNLSQIFPNDNQNGDEKKKEFINTLKKIYEEIKKIYKLIYNIDFIPNTGDNFFSKDIIDIINIFFNKLFDNSLEVLDTNQKDEFYCDESDIFGGNKFEEIIYNFIGKDNLLSILLPKEFVEKEYFLPNKSLLKKNDIIKLIKKKITKKEKKPIKILNSIPVIYALLIEKFKYLIGGPKDKDKRINERMKNLLRLGFMMNYLNLVIKQGEGIVTTLEHIKYFFMHSSINQNKVFAYNESDLGNYRQLGVKVDGKNPLNKEIIHEFPNKKSKEGEITENRNTGEMNAHKILNLLSEYSGESNNELSFETRSDRKPDFVKIPVDNKAVFIMLALIKRGETEQGQNDYSSNTVNVKKFTSAAQETLELANILKSEPKNPDEAKRVFNQYSQQITDNIIQIAGGRKKTKRKERKRKRIAKKKSRKYSRNYLKKQKRNNKK